MVKPIKAKGAPKTKFTGEENWLQKNTPVKVTASQTARSTKPRKTALKAIKR